MRQILMLPAAAIAMVVLSTPMPASADTRSLEDAVSTGAEPAPAYDLRRVTWNYTSDRFVVTSSRMARAKQGVVLTARAAHDVEGYVVEARTWWEGRKRFNRLWIWYNTVSRTPISCPGLRSRWRLNLIRLSIPNECLFDGAPLRDFSTATSRPGSAGVMDQISSAHRLDTGVNRHAT